MKFWQKFKRWNLAQAEPSGNGSTLTTVLRVVGQNQVLLALVMRPLTEGKGFF